MDNGSMSAPVLMVLSSLLFATMGVCVKLASALYGTGEIVFYRGLIGALFILGLARWRGGSVRTQVPSMHLC
jgi:S-adenosylmethionine uptake transporter